MDPQQKSIPADWYFYLQSIGSRCEGLVDGVGHVSSELVIDVSPKPHFPNQKRLGYSDRDRFMVPKFMPVVITGWNNPKYNSVTESDILRVVRKKNPDGSLRVNLGFNKIITLPPGSFVNVRIKQEVFDKTWQKTVTIFAHDPTTNSNYETRFPLNGIEYVLKEDAPATIRLPKGDGMPTAEDYPQYPSSITLGDVGRFVTYTGLALTVGQVVNYDRFLDIWLGKNGKFYKMSTKGNRYTGGREKYAHARSNKIGIFGYITGGISLFIIGVQWKRGDINTGWALAEAGSAVASTVGGSIGLAWGVGWEIGRWITTWESYQRFKYNFFYDHWESVVGPPSEYNKEMWDFFYENYQF